MEVRHIGSNERAALINLYSQYEFKDLEFEWADVESEISVHKLNELGADGWHVVSAAQFEDRIRYTMQRQFFSFERALERVKHGS